MGYILKVGRVLTIFFWRSFIEIFGMVLRSISNNETRVILVVPMNFLSDSFYYSLFWSMAT
jgi:hypothetical protein